MHRDPFDRSCVASSLLAPMASRDKPRGSSPLESQHSSYMSTQWFSVAHLGTSASYISSPFRLQLCPMSKHPGTPLDPTIPFGKCSLPDFGLGILLFPFLLCMCMQPQPDFYFPLRNPGLEISPKSSQTYHFLAKKSRTPLEISSCKEK